MKMLNLGREILKVRLFFYKTCGFKLQFSSRPQNAKPHICTNLVGRSMWEVILLSVQAKITFCVANSVNYAHLVLTAFSMPSSPIPYAYWISSYYNANKKKSFVTH